MRVSRTLILLVLVLVQLISQVISFPSLKGDLSEINSLKTSRQAGDPVDPFIPILEQLTAKLDPQAFSLDYALQQKLDRVNSISKYNDPMDNFTTIFERQVLDTDKEVVVLNPQEDLRPSKGRKRTYVILRKAHPPPELVVDPKAVFYHLVYAYIRDARASDSPTETAEVNANKISVEWDVFDNRPSIPTKFNTGWGNCAYTILFSCTMNQTAVETNVDTKTLQAITAQATPNPLGPPEPVAIAPMALQPIVTSEPGFDAEEYADLYGDFDLISRTGEKTGRGIFGSFGDSLCKGFSLFGGGGSCAAQPGAQPKRKKTYKVIQQTTYGAEAPPPGVYDPLYESVYGQPQQQPPQDSSSGYGSYFGLGNLFGGSRPASADRSQFSNADAIFGTYFVGVKGTPPIFLPDGTQTAVLFVPDQTGGNSATAHGFYIPGTAGYPDSFVPDDPAAVARIYSSAGTMIPDGMTMASMAGGIHGTLSGESFRPDTLGTPMWFNPESPESKGAWTPQVKADNKPSRPKTTANGELITYGVYFPGVSGSPDVFIPEGEGIPGYFVPNDPTKPDVVAIPHGSFIATKPAGHGSFYADNTKELVNVQQVRGAFMPDGMNLSGAISGLITKDVANSYVFVVDVPGQEFAYFKGKIEAQGMWTPFLKPGEWKPPATTPAPQRAAVQTTPSPTGAQAAKKPKVANPSFMFGIKFPGQSSMDIFIPDNYPVDGQMFPEDSNFQPIPGQMIVSKQPNTPFIFKPNDAAVIQSLPPTMPAMFIPDGIAGGNGIMGEISPDSSRQNCTYQSEPPGKGYWYIQGKPENLNVWTPFVPPVLPPTTRKPTIIDKIRTSAFLSGFYIPGVQGMDPVFIPEDGAIGCFVPDDNPQGKSCGTYYPERVGSKAEFVQDIPNKLRNNVRGFFVPELINGSISVDKFHATFVAGPPSTFILDKPAFQGWSQTSFKISTKKTTSTSTTTTEDHPTNIPIEVGGGFVGYPTNNRGIAALVDPNNPIFKEFLQWKSRKDKSITENDRIVITSNPQGQAGYQASAQSGSNVRTSFVSLEEYKAYVEERYTIKTTKIKTDNMNEKIELAIPKAAEKYVKKKKAVKINLSIDSKAYAGAGAGAGGGGAGGGGAGGSGSGGASGSGLGGKCGGKWSTSASATAIAQNGSNAQSDAHAINGGDAKAVSLAKDGARADSNANVKDGGKANAMTQAKNNSQGSATSNALNGAQANSLSKTSKAGGVGESVANAKITGEKERDGCDGGALPEEIEVDSHAAATALNNGTGGGGNVVNSYATTNVKIDMAGLLDKIRQMQSAQSEDDEDDESPPFDININTNSHAGAGAGASAAPQGRAFGGVEDQAKLFSKQTEGKSGAKPRAGWKTEYKIIDPGCTLGHEDQIFYGLGSCPYTTNPDTSKAASDDPEQVINFYLKVLRVDCLEKVKVRVMSLFNDDFLTFAADKDGEYLVLPKDNEIRLKPKILDADLRKLSAAFEIFIFTRTYFRHMNVSKSNAVVPYTASEGGPTASRSVRFLQEFALNFVETVREMSPAHYIRLTRNMLTTIRTLQIKLYQDGELLRKCPKCVKDIEMNAGDKVHAMALLQFLIHGLVPYDKGQVKDLRAAYNTFFKLNLNNLQSRVKEYELQFPKPQ